MKENASAMLDVPGKLHAGSFTSNPLAASQEMSTQAFGLAASWS